MSACLAMVNCLKTGVIQSARFGKDLMELEAADVSRPAAFPCTSHGQLGARMPPLREALKPALHGRCSNLAGGARAACVRAIPRHTRGGMAWMELIALVLAGAAAGLINALAGGGTLVTFPVLLLFGTSPIIANATSTTALVIGTAGSLLGFQSQLRSIRRWLARFVPASIVGGWLGSVLLTHSGERLFGSLVPYLILFATILFLLQEVIRKRLGPAAPRHTAAPWLAVGFQFAVAVYGGYFGAGIGILMLASLGLIGLTDIRQMNALKNVLGALINLVAAAWFVASGMVDWPRAGAMAAGAFAGYFAGASLSERIPRPMLRRAVTLIGFTLAAVMFYRQFA